MRPRALAGPTDPGGPGLQTRNSQCLNRIGASPRTSRPGRPPAPLAGTVAPPTGQEVITATEMPEADFVQPTAFMIGEVTGSQKIDDQGRKTFPERFHSRISGAPRDLIIKTWVGSDCTVRHQKKAKICNI